MSATAWAPTGAPKDLLREHEVSGLAPQVVGGRVPELVELDYLGTRCVFRTVPSARPNPLAATEAPSFTNAQAQTSSCTLSHAGASAPFMKSRR